MNKFLLSVIIPTRNRSSLLKRALISIINQSFSPERFEVIVVDNGSNDNTKTICNKFSKKIDNFRYEFVSQPGLHVGRHVGLRKAKSDVLVFADDDIKAFPTWLEGIIESFKDLEVALVGGKNLPLYESEPLEWVQALWKNIEYGRILPWYSLLDFGDEIKEIPPVYVWGCNFSIRKKVLIEAGGFHPDAVPQNMIRYRGDGETAVSHAVYKRGYKAAYNPKASVYHWVPDSRMTLEYIKKRSFNQGISDSYTSIRRAYYIKTATEKGEFQKVEASSTNLFILQSKILCYMNKLLTFKKNKMRSFIKRKLNKFRHPSY